MIIDEKFNVFSFYLNGIVNEKKQLASLSSKKKELDILIKDVNWRDLQIDKDPNNGNFRCYTVYLSTEIINKVDEIEILYKSFKLLDDIGQEILYEGDSLSMTCHIQVGSIDQRIDMSGDGIPRSIRGLGLGCKIYRAILIYEDYLSSEDHNLSSYGKMLWNSLRKNSLFYSFYDKNYAYCFASDKDPNFIIQTLEKKFKYSDEILWDDDFVINHSFLIEKSDIGYLL